MISKVPNTGSDCSFLFVAAGVPGVDVTEDYRGEARDVRRYRGSSYRFTFADYIVKTVVGSFDPAVHLVDLPAGNSCCVIA